MTKINFRGWVALLISTWLLSAMTSSAQITIPDTDPLPADSVPFSGTFYSALNPTFPPIPANINGLSAWNIGTNLWLLDDLEVGFAGRHALDETEDLGGGDTNTYVPYTFSKDGLWLEITNIANGWIFLNLHGGTNSVYEILSKPALSSTNWTIEGELWPTNTSVMPFTVPQAGRSNLFIWARDWTGVTEGTNTVPDWWFYNYYGTIALNDTNLDSQGNTLLYDYQNNLDPNIISFSVVVTNNYSSTSYAPVQLNVSAGTPYYVAVSIDDTNYQTNATWTPYTSSNLTVNLGSVQGWHDVWIGLRGLPDNATQAWQWKRLKLDSTPPQIVITGPASNTISQSLIQLTGYTPKALSAIWYDLTNVNCLMTNQQVLVLDKFMDRSTWEFTTNSFQAFDIELAPGTNIITIHATDLAGNEGTTNFSMILASDTNAPLINLVWPQNGMKLSGMDFNVFGTTDDTSAKITATLVDNDGNTNTYQALMERNGNFWFESLPFTNGVTSVTLTAVDIWSNITTTNIAISQSSMVLTLDAVDPDQLFLPTISVTGTVNDLTNAIWINGVQGVNNGDGTWMATNVPVSDGGTAMFYLSAYPPEDSLSANAAYPNANPLDVNAVNVLPEVAKQPRTYVAKMESNLSGGTQTRQAQYLAGDFFSDVWSSGGFIVHAADGADGINTYDFHDDWQANDSEGTHACGTVLTWHASLSPSPGNSTRTSTPAGCDTEYSPGLPIIIYCHMHIKNGQNYTYYYSDPVYGPGVLKGHGDGIDSADITIKHFTGGKASIKKKSIWSFQSDPVEHRPIGLLPPYNIQQYQNFPIPYGSVKIGELGQQDPDKILYVELGNCVTVDVTPMVSGLDYYTFDLPVATIHPLVSQVSCTAKSDPRPGRTSLGVGENVAINPPPYYMPAETHWKTSAGSLSALIGSSTALIAPSNASSATVTATVRKASATIDFDVKGPSGVIATVRARDSYGRNFAGAGMQLNVVIQPTTVSFGQVQVFEIGQPATGLSGYFANTIPPDHDSFHGANKWHPVACDNTITDLDFDNAGSGPWAGPWQNGGGYTWVIPAIWRAGSGPTNTLPGWTDQVITMAPDGTTTLTKLGHSVTRHTNEKFGTAH